MSNLIDRIWQDVRYGCRVFRKKPGFALAAVLPLALGVGAATALFSVVYAVVLDPSPYADADRTSANLLVDKAGRPHSMFLTAQQLVALRKSDVIEDAIALDIWTMTLTGDDLPESVATNYFSANGPRFLGLTTSLGRAFTEEDGPPGQDPDRVVLLTHRFWQSHFFEQADVIGKTIQLNREPYRVMGVVSERFDPFLGDVVVPIHLKFDPSFAWGVQLKLKRGISRVAAETSLTPFLDQFQKEAPGRFPAGLRVKLTTLVEQRRAAGVIPTLMSLFAATALLLLVACVNVSILLLARGTVRQQELAIRHSIGASRRRLLGQLLMESMMLSLMGAFLGVIFAYRGVPFVLGWLPPGALPIPASAVHVNVQVLIVSVTVTALSGILFGLWPAFSFSARAGALVQTAATRVAGGVHQQRGHQVLMIAQVALTVLLFVGTGAALRGLWALYRTDLNFDPHNVLVASADLSENSYMTWRERAAFFERVRDRIAGMPEVESAGLAVYTGTPPRFGERMGIEVPGPASTEQDFTQIVRSSPEYISAFKIPLVRGRLWSASENAQPARVAVINEAMAKRFWPNEDPIDKRVRVPGLARATSQFVLAAPGNDGWFEVIGVVRDVPNAGLRARSLPSMYIPYTAMLGDSANFVIRTRRDPMSMVRSLREQVREIDAHQPLGIVRTAETVLALQGWARERFVAVLLFGLATVALLVAAFGLYSVVSYSVSHRVREFGIRVAIGARQGDVLRLALARPLLSIAAGLGLGIAMSVLLNRALSKWSIGNFDDPLVLATTSVVLVAVTLAAALIPARHAASMAPGTAMRSLSNS
jgi:putative ABC transport system permease protein